MTLMYKFHKGLFIYFIIMMVMIFLVIIFTGLKICHKH